MPYLSKHRIIDIVDERFAHYWKRIYQKTADWDFEPRCWSLRNYATQKGKGQDFLFSLLRAFDARETAIVCGILNPEENLEEECEELLQLAKLYEYHDYRAQAKQDLLNIDPYELIRDSPLDNIDLIRNVSMCRHDKSADIDKDGVPFFLKDK
ncbi:MAG: hypothetical protein P1P64_03395 [Treponemataceae bacterium]